MNDALSAGRLFVSYAHEDAAAVATDVSELRARHFTIVSDEDIGAGEDWRAHIAEAVEQADAALFFSSSHSNASRHCLAEVGFALDLSKPVVVIMLEDCVLAPGLRLYLGQQQGLQRFRLDRGAYLLDLAAASSVACRGAARPAVDGTLALALEVRGEGIGDGALASSIEAACTWALAPLVEVRLAGPDEDAEATRVHIAVGKTGTGVTMRLSVGSGAERHLEAPDEPPTECFAVLLAALLEGLTAATGRSVPVDASDLLEADTEDAGALAAYVEGIAAGRAGGYEVALQHLRRAMDIDPGFALAARAATVACQVIGDSQGQTHFIERAFDGLPHLSEDQRTRTRFLYYMTAGDNRRAIPELEQYLERHPRERGVADNLALALLYARRAEEAVEQGRRNAEMHRTFITQANLAMYLMYAGRFEDAEAQLMQIEGPRDAFATDATLAICRHAQGDTEAAETIFGTLYLRDPIRRRVGALGLADLHACAGDPVAAVEALELEDDPDAPLMRTLEAWRGMHAARAGEVGAGTIQRRLPTVAGWGEKGPDLTSISLEETYLLARAALALGAEETAGRVITAFRSHPQVTATLYANLLEGELAGSRGEHARALELLGAARERLDTWMGRYLEAKVWAAAGMRFELRVALDDCVRRRGEAMAVMLNELPTMHLDAEVRRLWGA